MFERLKNIGPGAMVAAAFIGPGTVTTATLAGAGYGYTLLWAVLFSVIATYVLQEMSARLGIIGQLGLGEAIRTKFTQKALKIVVSVLVISAILIGNAAYEAGNISGAVMGFDQYSFTFSGNSFNPIILVIGILAFILLFIGKYKWIERSLIVLVTLMSIVFIISAILLQPDVTGILKGMFTPSTPKGSFLMIVGLIGTTVVPYNLFLHASSVKQKWSGEADLSLSKKDTLLAVIVGGLITMSIIITATVAFHGTGSVVRSAADLKVQLQPLLGDWSETFISFGFLAAGLSSAITAPLAASYATAGIMGWKPDLKSSQFRLVWITVLLIGIISSTVGFKPLMVILFAQVANGLLLPIIALFLLWVMNDQKIMGKHTNSKTVNILGIAVVGITLLLGIKSILTAFDLL